MVLGGWAAAVWVAVPRFSAGPGESPAAEPQPWVRQSAEISSRNVGQAIGEPGVQLERGDVLHRPPADLDALEIHRSHHQVSIGERQDRHVGPAAVPVLGR